MNTGYTIEKDEELWQLALKKNTIFHYDKYLSLMPGGKYVDEANTRKNQLLEIQEAAIAKFWNETLAENTYFAVLRFKNKYPNSKFAAEVERKLIELESSKKQEIQQIDEKFVVPEGVDDGEFLSNTEKKGVQAGVIGGIAMMAIAVILFVIGYAAGRIFFYPIILFGIGVFAFFKGIGTGNISGNKKD
jgi:hypothetical protein